MRPRKAQQVLDTARELFLARGYAATTLDDVAREAGVSKATVYNNVADKQALLLAVVDQVTTRSAAIVTALRDRPVGVVGSDLRRLLVDLARGVTAPDVVALRRLVVAETPRLPSLGPTYADRAPRAGVEVLRGRIVLAVAADELEAGAEDDAEWLAYAVVAPEQDRALLTGEAPDLAALENRAERVVAAFVALRGVASGPAR